MRHSSTASIIASYGNRGILQTEDAQLRYLLQGRQLRPVCGDSVSWTPSDNKGEALVKAVLPRRNALERLDGRGKTETLAANIETLAVVIAAEPRPDYFIVDRFLCAGELIGAKCLIVWNKNDLPAEEPAELQLYRDLGYPLVSVSATTSAGIAEFEQQLNHGFSMLVGQSGVGKSSLINCLITDADAAIGELSSTNREGRHTTTASFAHALRAGGMLIDSPGIRDFAPAIQDASRIQAGFREIVDTANACRFSDCTHTREPNCAVKAAVDSGTISARRYDSYKRMRNINAKAIVSPR